MTYTPLAPRSRHRNTAVAFLAFALTATLAGCGNKTSGAADTTQAPVAPAVSWQTPASVVYGTALSSTQLNATAAVPGTWAYTPAIGAVPHAGNQTITAVFTPTNTPLYTSVTLMTTLVVTPVTPVVTFTVPPAVVTGVALDSTHYFASAVLPNGATALPGTFAYSPAQGTALTAGSHSVSVTFTPTDATDYTTVTQTATITAGTTSFVWNNVTMVAGGFITGIVAHPTTPNLRYVRTDIGGTYRWNATASQWIPVLDFLTSNQDNDLGTESIALDPTNAQNLYIAAGTYAAESFAGNGAMLISNNQGATFNVVPVNFKIGSNDSGRFAGERLAVDPNLPTKLYFGSRLSGLQVSTNGGLTWSQVASFPVIGTTSGVGVVFVDFLTASGSAGTATPVIYVGVSDGGAAPNSYATLYRSIDGGNTWAAVPGAPAGLTGMYVNHGVFGPNAYGSKGDNSLYLSYGNQPGPTGVTAGYLYQYSLPSSASPGGAGIWNNITPVAPARPVSAQGGFGTIAVDPEIPGVLMAGTMDDYNPGDDIYRSTNYGTTWNSVDNIQGATHNYTTNCAYLTFNPVVPCSTWLNYHNSGAVVGTGNWPGSILIDPFNSNHVMYGTGQTLWDSANIQVSDLGTAATWNIGAYGIEEASVGITIAPSGGSYLLSGVGDFTGFVHTTLTASPAQGMIGNSAVGSHVNSIDYAQNAPLNVVVSATNYGNYATDAGVTATSWKSMNPPTGSTAGSGTIAISSDGKSIVWDTSDGPVASSTNFGTTWTSSTGAITKSNIYSDRVSPTTFYIVSGNTLQISTNSGQTFTTVTTALPNGSTITPSFAAAGDLWNAAGGTLQHSTNFGTTWTAVTGLSNYRVVAIGAGQAGATYPAVYVMGTGPQGTGVYQSLNQGATWTYCNDAAHQFAYTTSLAASPVTYGLIYLGTNGRGILYANSSY